MLKRLIFYVCGALWLIYGMLLFAFAMSIVRASEQIYIYRKYAFIVILVYLFLGIYFIYSGYLERRHQKYRAFEKQLVNLLLSFKYGAMLLQFAVKCNIGEPQAVNFIEDRMNYTHNTLDIDEKGIIRFDYRNYKV